MGVKCVAVVFMLVLLAHIIYECSGGSDVDDDVETLIKRLEDAHLVADLTQLDKKELEDMDEPERKLETKKRRSRWSRWWRRVGGYTVRSSGKRMGAVLFRLRNRN